MAKGQKYIVVDDYTLGLLQKIVDQGKASNLSNAIGKSAAAFIGVPYKSREERKMEQDLARVIELARLARKEE